MATKMLENLDALHGLSDEQLKGFDNFKLFMQDPDQPIAVLHGAGGTGKTYSLAKWLIALGIKPEQVIGIAPTNESARVLRRSLHSAGFLCQVSTGHSFLGLAPSTPTWGEAEDHELKEARELLEAETVTAKRINLAARINILRSQLQAFRDGKLVFNMSEWFEAPPGVKLYVVDEASMLSSEMDGLINENLLLGTGAKILKMGDELQLFPVGEGMSPAFDAPSIAEFREIRRSSGQLRDLNLAMRQSQDVTVAHQILKSLPFYNPETFGDNQACTITRKMAKEIFGQWSTKLNRDGHSYRYIAFKRAIIDRTNTASLKLAEQAAPPRGSYLMADSPVTRWCFSDGNKTILFNGERVPIKKVLPSYTASIPGFGDITIHQMLVPVGDPEDPYDRRRDLPGLAYWERPYHFLGKGQRESIKEHSIVRWTNDPAYFAALEFWGKIKNALYSAKAPTPGSNEAVQQLFEWLGIESWTAIKGVPGYKTHKPKDINLDLFTDSIHVLPKDRDSFRQKITDHEGNVVCEIGRGKEKRGLRPQVYALYRWLSDGVIDPVKPVAASTVYKSQGNTIERVMIDLGDLYASRRYGGTGGDNAYRALYTAVSRASKQLYVIID